MILVLFEVKARPGCMEQYLELAAALKESLARAEGFVRSERFASLANEGKLLSLSVWESEEAVEKWRNQAQHRLSQRQGRDSVFESFTITIASPLRTYTATEREEAPADSNTYFADVSLNLSTAPQK